MRYVAVEVSAAQRARHPRRRRVARRDCRTSRSSASCWPTSCSTTCRSGSPSTTAAGARRSSPPRPDGTFAEVLSAPFDPLPAVLPARPPHGARAPLQDAAARLGHAARALVRAGPVVVVDYARPTHRRAGAAAVAVVAADVPRPRRGVAPARRAGRPGHHRRRRRRPAAGARRRAQPGPVPAACTGSTSSSTRAGAAWAAAAAQPDLRGAGDAQPRRRGRGAARPGGPRRVHRPRVVSRSPTTNGERG